MELIKQQLGECPVLSIVGAIFGLLAIVVLALIYFSGLKEHRARKRNRQHFERDLERVRRKKRKVG